MPTTVSSQRKNSVESSLLYILEGGGTPFLDQNSIVRFSSTAMSGSTTSVEIDGPARLVRRNQIVRLQNGHQAIGAQEEEFEVQLTGKGKVSVTISVQSPTSGFPEVTEHVIAAS